MSPIAMDFEQKHGSTFSPDEQRSRVLNLVDIAKYLHKSLKSDAPEILAFRQKIELAIDLGLELAGLM